MPRARSRLVLRRVNLASKFVATGNHEQASQCNVLVDHESEFRDFGVLEMFTKLSLEGAIDGSVIGRETFGKSHRQRVSGFELPFCLREVDLRNDLFGKSLTRRRRVPSEESGVALIDGSDLETRELFHARRNDAFDVSWLEELEPASEVFRNQGTQVERIISGRFIG